MQMKETMMSRKRAKKHEDERMQVIREIQEEQRRWAEERQSLLFDESDLEQLEEEVPASGLIEDENRIEDGSGEALHDVGSRPERPDHEANSANMCSMNIALRRRTYLCQRTKGILLSSGANGGTAQ